MNSVISGAACGIAGIDSRRHSDSRGRCLGKDGMAKRGVKKRWSGEIRGEEMF